MFLDELFRHFLLMMSFGGFLILSIKMWEWFNDSYMLTTIGGWFGRQEIVYLRIFPPEENESSMGEMEAFFDTLCGVYDLRDSTDLVIEGTFYDHFSFEYHSIGGKIGIFVRLRRPRVQLLRSLMEARFPGTKIVESPDPLEGLPPYWNNGAGPYKQSCIADMNLVGGDEVFDEDELEDMNDIFPIRPWKDYQKDDNSPIADPLHHLFSVLEAVPEDVHVFMEYVMRPLGSEDKANKIKQKWLDNVGRVKAKMAQGNSMKTLDNEGNLMLMFTDTEREELDRIIRKINNNIILMKIRVGIFSITSDARLIFDEINGYFKQFTGRYVELYAGREGRTWVKDTGRHSGVFGPWFGAIADQVYWKKEKQFRDKWLYRSLKFRSIDMVELVNEPVELLNRLFPWTTESLNLYQNIFCCDFLTDVRNGTTSMAFTSFHSDEDILSCSAEGRYQEL